MVGARRRQRLGSRCRRRPDRLRSHTALGDAAGGVLEGLAAFPDRQTDSTVDSGYYKLAIKADTSLTSGVDAMVSFAPIPDEGRPTMIAFHADRASAGGSFEALPLVLCLNSLGFTTSSSPTAAATVVTLRASALQQTI